MVAGIFCLVFVMTRRQVQKPGAPPTVNLATLAMPPANVQMANSLPGGGGAGGGGMAGGMAGTGMMGGGTMGGGPGRRGSKFNQMMRGGGGG